ncbi:MAG: hypothetical protein QM758_29095 [Armatimonas sp.]
MKQGLNLITGIVLTGVCGAAWGQGSYRDMRRYSSARNAETTAWMKVHTYRAQVLQEIQSLLDFDTVPFSRLKPDQRKKLFLLLNPWRKKPKMTEEQAHHLKAAMVKIYSRDQIVRQMSQNISAMPGNGRMMGLRFSPSVDPYELLQAKEFNPLNPATLPTEPLQLSFGGQVDLMFRMLQRKN